MRKAQIFIIGIVSVIIFIGFISNRSHNKAVEVEKKIDSRFKYYDFQLINIHESLCVHMTKQEIEEYYSKFEAEITPLGKDLLEGKFKCD